MTLAENLREFWPEHTIHVAVAGLAGYLLTTGVWPAGAAIVVSQHVRQVCGYWSKRDTINHDLAVVQAGLVTGVVIGLVLSRLVAERDSPANRHHRRRGNMGHQIYPG